MHIFAELGLFLALIGSTSSFPASIASTSLATGLQTRSNTQYALPAHLVHDFPTATWMENVAVRSNGQILATEDAPSPILYQVDPFGSGRVTAIHKFTDSASLLGIVETSPDVFHVCSSNYSSKLLQGYGEDYIFRVDLRSFEPDKPESAKITQVASVPNAKSLNGMTYLGGQANLLLISDFIEGVVWTVDLRSGESRISINNTYTRSTGFGVNGMKVFDDHLYFTNSQQGTLVKVPVNSRGEAAGPFTVLARDGFEPDDFAIDAKGDCYVASFLPGQNGIAFVPREGGNPTIIAGVQGPTGAAFGRTAADRDTLYISTSGGDFAYFSPPVKVSGKIVKVNVDRQGMAKPY